MDKTPSDLDLKTQVPTDRPPIFSSWAGWYVLLIAVLLVSIVVFHLFGSYYS